MSQIDPIREAGATAADQVSDFVRDAIQTDLGAKRFDRVQTRFPPEPNGYLHIGHAKAICLNFGVAEEHGGVCMLRFDDTNPAKEKTEYVQGIMADIRWLGFGWGVKEVYASDYFEQLFAMAEQLVQAGKAYVDSLSAEQVSEYRGAPTQPGRPSPYRDRPVAENLDLLRRMRAGEFPDGAHSLRAKIDMASPNLNMRDPVMYRIRHARHHRTGDAWCIYPLYDWAHGQSDSIEGVTFSLCDLSYENHRPLYDWFLEALGIFHPRQIEFNKLHLTFTVESKRNLGKMVEDGVVQGWDDPRLPTLRGLRRRGFPPTAIRAFCRRVGASKTDTLTDISLLEYFVREELNRTAPRAMAVLDPLRLVITNYPTGKVEHMEAENNPEDPKAGSRMVPFSGELFIERDDFREDPPKKFFRLSPGKEIRLKHAYYVRCDEVIKDATGAVVELRCSYDPETRGGWSTDGRKVRGTAHWVSAAHGVDAEVRLYDRLFTQEDMTHLEEGQKITDFLTPESLQTRKCKVEPSLGSVDTGRVYQFLRQGYFSVDPDSLPGAPVFNRTITLKDSWAKILRDTGSAG